MNGNLKKYLALAFRSYGKSTFELRLNTDTSNRFHTNHITRRTSQSVILKGKQTE